MRTTAHVDDRLGRSARRAVRAAVAADARIDAISSSRSEWPGLSPATVVSVALADGRQMAFFVKSIGSEQPDHPDKRRRDRELQIYEVLLASGELPTVRYYGVDHDARLDCSHLLLEHVHAWNLEHHGFDRWYEAARQLARLHAYFAHRRELLAQADALLPLDGDYFTAWAKRAGKIVERRSSALARPLRRILDRYAGVVELLEREPRTLVHNDLSPKNVLADPRVRPPRICFVDWELSGAGCGLLDLVHLRYGLPRRESDLVLSVYCGELAGTDVVPEEDRQLAPLLAACELHKTLYRIARADAWGISDSIVSEWVDESVRFARHIARAPRETP